ncbi:MFS transporter [Streptomyces sp. YPW6]|uniref:MFS transporter n=1 Tax=Streptomyces sp. YPW6 TaxID=2840373 RepID=UPI001C0D50C2|nr:MFS transporter [Streptomyces sp. YPW6]QWQ42999.1 MFS transporter [Streptomyces sp. YPW6]
MLADLLPASRNGRIIAAGSAVEAVAVGMFLAAATLYFVGIVGIPAVAVGGALTVANVIGLLSPAPTGALAGRIGPLPVYVGLTLLRAVGFVAYAFVDGYAGYFVVTCLITAATRAAMPLLQVIVGELEPADRRTRTMASLRAVSNIGMTAGFLLAAVVQASGSRPVFMALFGFNGLAFVAVALLIGRAARDTSGLRAPHRSPAPPQAGPVPDAAVARDAADPAPAGQPATGPTAEGREPAAAHPARSPYRDRRFLTAALANAVLLLHDSILFILVPLWVTQQAGLPGGASSVVLAVNTVLTVVLQVYVSRFAQGVTRSLRLLRLSCLPLVLSCVLFAAADGRGVAVALVAVGLAVVALTVGENLHAVAAWELSYEMAHPASRPQYLSVFGMGMSAQLIVGPFLMTAFVLKAGTAGWLVIAALFAAATAAFSLAARPYARKPPAAEPSAAPRGGTTSRPQAHPVPTP